MMRRNRNAKCLFGNVRCGESTTPIIAAVAGVAVLSGALFLVIGSQPSTQSISPVKVGQVDSVSESSATTAIDSARTVADRKETSEANVSSEVIAANKKSAARDNAASRLERVEAQLAAGEFGPALDIVQTATDAREKTHLLKLIAQAQMKAGEFDAALSSIRRIPIAEERDQARGERAENQALAGGSGADFESLIELIQEETEGPWEEVDGDGGTITEYETGVRVDPNGLLVRLTREEQTGRLDALGIQARIADLNKDMAQPSKLRMVSLTRLEKEVAKRVANGEPVVETMKRLAGLTQIQYVFVYPEEHEIVIAGPAEGWQYNENGLSVGSESGKPTLQLDDFVTVLRTFLPGGHDFFNCLIVPRQENMKAIEAFVARSNSRGPLRRGAGVRNWVRQLEETLGQQDVVVNGIPLDSRVARVIVEADYRMKLIGIDKLEAADIPSYFDLLPLSQEAAPPTTVGLRWWMTMKYDAILHSTNRNVFEIQGSSVQCLSEDEMITSDGQRVHTGKSSPTNRLFAQKFTEKFSELASSDIVFADMQNIFDLALVAALIRNEQLVEKADWDFGTFTANGSYQPARYEPPKTVMTVANHRVYNGKDIVVQVAGGVRADLMKIVRDVAIMRTAPRLGKLADHSRAPQLPAGRWWWDAAE